MTSSQSGAAARRKREREERRCAILDAAERVFLAKGFAFATMDEVAADAEVSKGTVYLYFDSKDELFVAIALRMMSQLAETYDDIASRDAPGLDTVRALARAYVGFARARQEHFRLGMSWLHSGAAIDPETRNYPAYRALIQRFIGQMIDAIRRGQDDGSIREDIDPAELGVQLWGGSVGLLLLNANQDEMNRRTSLRLDFEHVLSSFIDRLLASIKPEATP